MDIWYTEYHTDNVRLSIRIDRQLASVQSEFQRIDVFDSVEFGRIMTLDGLLMVTEKDEYIYHEMITHIPMATNPSSSMRWRFSVLGGSSLSTSDFMRRRMNGPVSWFSRRRASLSSSCTMGFSNRAQKVL